MVAGIFTALSALANRRAMPLATSYAGKSHTLAPHFSRFCTNSNDAE